MLFLSRIYIELTELEESVSFYTRILLVVDFQFLGIWKLNHNFVYKDTMTLVGNIWLFFLSYSQSERRMY